MQVWQLFHILQEYCQITGDNATLYCNMIKFLLHNKYIHGTQTIKHVTNINSKEWESYFSGSLYSMYNVNKLQSILLTIHEYLSSHNIVSIITPLQSATLRRIPTTNQYPQSSSYLHLGTIGLSITTGFVLGYLYTLYISK
jgi:CHAT domain-containing protein